MSSLVPLMTQVARRELAAHRSLALGVVGEVFTNEGGSAEHHLECSVRLHGSGLTLTGVPVAVARPGLSVAPRPGDLVVLGFVDGDVNGAIVLGTLHSDGTPPPDAAPDEVVYAVPDSGGERRFELLLPNGNALTVTDDAVTMAMGSTTVTIEADGAITMEAGADITLKANGALTLEAASTATLKGASVSVQGSGSAELKGSTTTIAGMTSFSAG